MNIFHTPELKLKLHNEQHYIMIHLSSTYSLYRKEHKEMCWTLVVNKKKKN